jgi:SagB-type dehydrogenase family enzyme
MPRSTTVPAALAVLMGVVLVGVMADGPAAPGSTPGGWREVEALPSPRVDGQVSLEAALQGRRSVRSFGDTPLTIEQIGQLLWAAQGVTDDEGHRTAPSAGATYPLELDVVTADGLARYLPDGHRLAWRGAVDLRATLAEAALGQAAVLEAPLVLVISGVQERTAARYGKRAERYVAMEAGHAAQNVLLEAVSLDLGAVLVGAFDDVAVRRLLGLADGEAPLYLVPVGHPR